MEATLQDILEARERRAARQQQLLGAYGRTLVCFTMNIAGPEKYSPLIAEGFRLGCERLTAQLAQFPILYSQRLPRHTGCEAFFVVDADPDTVKKRTVAIEEADDLGRLFDMDVFRPDGTRLERERERRCLLCGESAKVCGRSRAHSVQALQEATGAILTRAVFADRSRFVGEMAAKALLYEVGTTPKPGLVDRENSGSHRDMDIFTFMASTAALQPYFTSCALAGMETARLSPEVTFEKLRFLGRDAEQTMVRATHGVNTHKGAIFTMGVLCGAVGRLWAEESPTPAQLLDAAASLCKGLTARDFAGITEENAKTAGQKLYARHGITGIRGQAEQGFPAVRYTGLPVLREGLGRGLSLERAGCAALLAMLTAANDTNLIARSDRETARGICREVALLLSKNRYPDGETLRALDDLFTGQNLSPGGTADLLAATYFLHFYCD